MGHFFPVYYCIFGILCNVWSIAEIKYLFKKNEQADAFVEIMLTQEINLYLQAEVCEIPFSQNK